MNYYFIDIKLHCSVAVEQHKRGSFTVSDTIKASASSARKEYIKKLKTIAKELDDAIMYIEQTKSEHIPPVLLRSVHGRNNTDIDNEYNTSTFGEL